MKNKKQPILNECVLLENKLSGNSSYNQLLENIYKILEEKIDDPELSIANLAQQLNISRVQLHRKVKSYLGVPASELVRNFRLKKSILYLEQGYNSSETAFMIGFDSPSYFSKCFKRLYGQTPIQYQNNSNK